jgi:hypothetical protein
MNAPAPTSGNRPVLLLAALCLLGWLACALLPRLLQALGITDYGQWYLDSYAVLAASDAVRAGVSPDAANPLDPLLRNHKYSDWWFGLRWLGLTRESNFLLGTSWVAAFALAAWLTLKPRNFREAGWLAVLLLSPPVLLGINRANNDLVIFTLLAVCGAAAAVPAWPRQALALCALALATGLKFYPAPAALAFLWVRPVRRAPWATLVAVLVGALVLASVWPQIARGQFPVDSTMHTLGAPLLGRELGWSDAASLLVSVVGCTLGAVALVASRCTAGLASQGLLRERLLAAVGAIVLLACFAAGVSYAYRWIFALWLALWLWRRAEEFGGSARARWTVRAGLGLLLFGFWSDGLLCLVVNRLLPSQPQTAIDALQVSWRLWTQPLHWILMILLAGWLLEGALATGREWRASRVAC